MTRLGGILGLGLRAAWLRQRWLGRILDTAPVTDTVDERCEIHICAGSRNWLDVLWTLKSFYRHAKRRYRLCLHDDGSLDEEGLGALVSHLPSARLLTRVAADGDMAARLASSPRLASLRQRHTGALMLTDAAALSCSSTLLLLDAGVLFFASPDALLERIEDPRFDRCASAIDLRTDYAIDSLAAREQFGVLLVPLMDRALTIAPAAALRTDVMEQALAVPAVASARPRMLLDTLFGLACSVHGAELLPGDYAGYDEPGIDGRPLRRYSERQRGLYHREGLRTLIRGGLLQ